MKTPDTFPTYMLIIPIWLFGLTSLHAQEAVLASGGDATGSGGSVSYSVGQIAYNTDSGIFCNSVAQGVQQPYEISTMVGSVSTSTTECIVGIEQYDEISLEYSAYPNPVTDMLTLTVDNPTENTSYRLYSVNGKLLQNGKVTNGTTDISMHQFASGTYLLTVLKNETETKTFQIIKN